MPSPAQPSPSRKGRHVSERAGLSRLAIALVVAALLGTTLVASLGSGRSPRQSSRRASSRTHRSPSSAQSPHGHRSPPSTQGTAAPQSNTQRAANFESHLTPRARKRHPGTLPQTEAKPTARTVAFRREMSALWAAIVSDQPHRGTEAFFPKGAYLQLKAIEDASGDYSDRLFHDYALDIHAAHALLGVGAKRAQLVRVEVPPSYAHWIPPNVCYNRVGYWETPNSRIIYREGRRLRSFGIASLISWRGVWYVVHLGAILRSGEEGVVDAPTSGIGVAEPSSTC